MKKSIILYLFFLVSLSAYSQETKPLYTYVYVYQNTNGMFYNVDNRPYRKDEKLLNTSGEHLKRVGAMLNHMDVLGYNLVQSYMYDSGDGQMHLYDVAFIFRKKE